MPKDKGRGLKYNEQWCTYGRTCAEGTAPKFRAVRLSTRRRDVLVDVELTILDGGVATENSTVRK